MPKMAYGVRCLAFAYTYSIFCIFFPDPNLVHVHGYLIYLLFGHPGDLIPSRGFLSKLVSPKRSLYQLFLNTKAFLRAQFVAIVSTWLRLHLVLRIEPLFRVLSSMLSFLLWIEEVLLVSLPYFHKYFSIFPRT